MTEEKLRITIKNHVENNVGFTALHHTFMEFKNEGGQQETACDVTLSIMKLLRSEGFDEDKLEPLIDVADFVFGYCTPDKKIWKESK